MSGGFVKLDSNILDSSIWAESAETRVVWLTMLAMADSEGLVHATAPGISRSARVSIDAVRLALATFEAPDADSRTLAHDGRRIERVDGGYRLLNYLKYREKDYTAAERMRRYRERQKESSVTAPLRSVTQAEAEAEAEAEAGRKERPASLPADVTGEKLLHASRVAKERRFYAAVARLSELQPEKDPPDIARELTGYTAKAGHKVKGVARPEGLSDERLDKSLEDAQWWIDDLTKPKGDQRGA